MQFELGEEQQELQRSIRAFTDRHADPLEVLKDIDRDTGFAPDSWATAATKMGLQSLAVPEAFGGMGAGPLEVMIAVEELGAAVVPGPLALCVGLVVPTLTAAVGSPVAASMLAAIAEGGSIVSLATDLFTPVDGRPTVEVTVVGADEVTVTGTARRVVAPQGASTFVMRGVIGDDIAVVAVPADGDGVTVTMHTMLDPTRREGDVDLINVVGQIVARGDRATSVIDAARRSALLFAAAEAVGGAERAMDLAVKYAKERQAFGKVIGSFQALKHRMADMYTDLELARTLLWFAAWLASPDAPEDTTAEAVEGALLEAKLVATEGFLRTARSAVGIFGGIGYTWEHPIHLYFKRATALRLFAQPNAAVREEIATRTLARGRRGADAAQFARV